MTAPVFPKAARNFYVQATVGVKNPGHGNANVETEKRFSPA